MGLRTWLGLKKRKSAKVQPARISRIQIFRADPMTYTLFSDSHKIRAEFKQIGVTYVSDPEAADIIVARRPHDLAAHGHLDRKFLIFTHEPSYAFIEGFINHVEGVRNPVHLMTAYNGRVYADHFFYGPNIEVDFDERMRAFKAKPRRTVMLAAYRRKGTRVRNGVNIDLCQRRQALALALHRSGECDLYGKHWPKEIQVFGNGRGQGWHSEKQEVLNGYKINIAFENTIIPFYITEKLWDAIAGACLPVYHGAENGIYGVMPRNSFIEAAERDVDKLKEQILSMPDDEMEGRYERCLRQYVDLVKNKSYVESRKRFIARTTECLQDMMK